MARKHVVWLARTAVSLLFAACASSPTMEPSSAESTGSPSADDSPKANTETAGTCDDQTCVGTEDCCKGFACGFDPERSRVQRYCLKE